MSPRNLLTIAASALVALPSLVQAQIGYPPAESPFRDLEYRQEVTAEAGYLFAQRDPAGVAPKSAPIVGLRYAAQFGSPLVLSARLGTAFSERDVIDPAAAPANRFVRTETVQLALLDVAVGVAFTGFRRWHGLVPEASAGVGVAGAFDEMDAGGYRFGTPFALNGGGGVRWAPGGHWQLRADLTHRMYRISYPQSYYQTTGGEAVLGPQDRNSRWTHNPAITIGVSYLFDR